MRLGSWASGHGLTRCVDSHRGYALLGLLGRSPAAACPGQQHDLHQGAAGLQHGQHTAIKDPARAACMRGPPGYCGLLKAPAAALPQPLGSRQPHCTPQPTSPPHLNTTTVSNFGPDLSTKQSWVLCAPVPMSLGPDLSLWPGQAAGMALNPPASQARTGRASLSSLRHPTAPRSGSGSSLQPRARGGAGRGARGGGGRRQTPRSWLKPALDRGVVPAVLAGIPHTRLLWPLMLAGKAGVGLSCPCALLEAVGRVACCRVLAACPSMLCTRAEGSFWAG